jgi:RhoGEF domain/Calponin homology (CH) domain/IQ calmodulin-binding motif
MTSLQIELAKREWRIKKWIELVLEGEVKIDVNGGLSRSDGGEECATGIISRLQDGIVLCKLLSKMKERSIPTIHENTSFRFKMRENVVFFVAALEECGVNRYDLFAVPDLHQGKNSVRVLETLETWARYSHSGRCGSLTVAHDSLPDLDSIAVPDGAPNGNDDSIVYDDNFYATRCCSVDASNESLLEFADRRKNQVSRTMRATSSASSSSAADDEQASAAPSYAGTFGRRNFTARPVSSVGGRQAAQASSAASSQSGGGGRLLMLNGRTATHAEHAAATRIQAAARGYLARRLLEVMVRDQAYRSRVAREILQTETSYIASLEAILNVYAAPLRAPGKRIVSEDWCKKVFSDIGVIMAYSGQLHGMLKPRVDTWDENPHQCIGDIFVKQSAFFRVYTQYVNQFDDRVSLVQEESATNRKLADFLRRADTDPAVGGLNLPALLIQPVQRIPRYGKREREKREASNEESLTLACWFCIDMKCF